MAQVVSLLFCYVLHVFELLWVVSANYEGEWLLVFIDQPYLFGFLVILETNLLFEVLVQILLHYLRVWVGLQVRHFYCDIVTLLKFDIFRHSSRDRVLHKYFFFHLLIIWPFLYFLLLTNIEYGFFYHLGLPPN